MSSLVISTTQQFNRRSFGFLFDKRATLDPGQSKIINSINNNMKKTKTPGVMEQSINYKHSTKKAGKLGYGRLYGTTGSLETLEKECRGTICRDFYHDIDIENCHPVILVQFAKNKYNVDLPEVDKYVDNREMYLKSVMDENGISREDAKQAVISILYGGSCSPVSFLYALSSEVRGFSKKLFKIDTYAELAEVCKAEDNRYGSFLSYVLQTEERNIMLTMKSWFEKEGWSVDALCYDGVMIRKREGVEYDLKACEMAIKEKTGYIVKLVNKEFSYYDMPTVSDEITKGVSAEVYNKMKEDFEKSNFYYAPANEMIEVRGNELCKMSLDHAREYYSAKWRFSHSERFDDYTTFFDVWRKDPTRRMIYQISMKESDDPGVFVLPPRFAWTEEGIESNIAVEKFCEIIELLGNEEQQRYIIRWLAQMIQKPFERCGTALVISGDKRTGKDTPFDFFRKYVIGEDYSRNYTCSGYQFFDKHDTGRMNMLLCKVEEANRKVFIANADKFKSLITADSEMFNYKGKNPISVENYNRFVLTTNGACPVELSDGEQRFLVATCSNARKHDLPYWTEVRSVLFNKEAGRAVGRWLNALDISGFEFRKVPQDEFQNTIVESEATSEDMFVKDWDGVEISMIDLYNKYRSFCADRALPMCLNSKSFGHALLKLLRNKSVIKKHRNDGNYYSKPPSRDAPPSPEDS